MNENLIRAAIFTAGAVVGSAITMLTMKKKYQQMADEQVESVREAMFKIKKASDESKNKPLEALKKYHEVLDNYIPVNPDGEDSKSTYPYIIMSQEFGDLGYEQIALAYFMEDGILVDENLDPVDNVEEVIGTALDLIDDDTDALYIRNDEKRCDYEVIVDMRSYAEVKSKRPRRIEV